MENRKAGEDRTGLDILENLPQDPALAPLLRDLAAGPVKGFTGVIQKRLDRRYARLCAVQEELGKLNSRQPGQETSFEDFVFSGTDFSRYAVIGAEHFELYTSGLDDYGDAFFARNFRLSREEAAGAIAGSYKKTNAGYCLLKPGPLILSLMRTLETSLEMVPLLCEEEILGELKAIYAFLGAGPFPPGSAGNFFRFLVRRLDQVTVIHHDKRETKLFVSPEGGLSGIFRPQGKPWTLSLIPAASS